MSRTLAQRDVREWDCASRPTSTLWRAEDNRELRRNHCGSDNIERISLYPGAGRIEAEVYGLNCRMTRE